MNEEIHAARGREIHSANTETFVSPFWGRSAMAKLTAWSSAAIRSQAIHPSAGAGGGRTLDQVGGQLGFAADRFSWWAERQRLVLEAFGRGNVPPAAGIAVRRKDSVVITTGP